MKKYKTQKLSKLQAVNLLLGHCCVRLSFKQLSVPDQLFFFIYIVV